MFVFLSAKVKDIYVWMKRKNILVKYNFTQEKVTGREEQGTLGICLLTIA